MSVTSMAVKRVGAASQKAGSLNQLFGLVFGAVYVLVGIVGFVVTRGVGFAAPRGHELIVFGLNPLHNIVHLAVGALFLGGAAAGLRWSRRINVLVGAVYLGVGLAGLFVVGSALNIIALNHADNGLHFASALLALLVGLRRDRPGDRTVGATQESGADAATRRVEGSISGGEVVTAGGTYRCSCKDFAVWVRPGGRLPECPVGPGHFYTLAPKKTVAPSSTTSSTRRKTSPATRKAAG